MNIRNQNSAHERLRNETAELHRRLDQLEPMKRLMQPTLTEASYSATLLTLLQWTETVSLRCMGLDLPEYASPARKINALQQDLRTLDLPLPTTPRMSVVNDPSFALGIHYVLEGASMGARILAPRIESSLMRQDVTAYYRLYGEDTLTYWQQTVAHLEKCLDQEESRATACQGARWAFESLIQRFIANSASEHAERQKGRS